MAYGICRIQKLKAGAVGRSAQHTSRKRETPNADPEKQHIRIIGQPDNPNTPDLETLVRQHIGDQTIRKNAVLAVEFLLTASPEYFRPDDPSRAGYYEQQRLESFQQKACEWLQTLMAIAKSEPNSTWTNSLLTFTPTWFHWMKRGS